MINLRYEFRFFILYSESDTYYVIDIATMQVERVTYDELQERMKDGVVYNDFKDLPIGVNSDGNKYTIAILGKNHVYDGVFQSSFNNLKIYDHNITHISGISTKGYLIFQVTCQAYIMLERELPVNLVQCIVVDLNEPTLKGKLLAYTSKPYHICKFRTEFKLLQEEVSLPKGICVLLGDTQTRLEDKVIIGVSLKNITSLNTDLSSMINFLG